MMSECTKRTVGRERPCSCVYATVCAFFSALFCYFFASLRAPLLCLPNLACFFNNHHDAILFFFFFIFKFGCRFVFFFVTQTWMCRESSRRSSLPSFPHLFLPPLFFLVFSPPFHPG
jgi:hypothetical protein